MASLAPPTNLVATASSSLKAPTISTTSLPAAIVGAVYSSQLSATGGLTPYTWGLDAGNLPAGLTLSSTGLISGTPTTSGSSSFTILCTDAASQTAQMAMIL
jgi:hypothetical protein